MEEQEPSGKIDNPQTAFPSPQSQTTEAPDETGSTAQSFLAAAAKEPPLAQRLAEAFREGVASARPDCGQRPDIGTPARAKKNPQESSGAGIGDRIIREGGSAAAVVGDKAAGFLGSFVQVIKKAPALTHKYAEAFREGAASVQKREGRTRREERPKAAKEKGTAANGRAILARVLHAGESAAGFVREAVSVVKPGEVIGARQKIRLGQKRINQLYIDIGAEAAGSWSAGQVETEKIAALLDELRKSEEEILSVQVQLAEMTTASKTMDAGRPQRVKKAAAVTPAADITAPEDSPVAAGDSVAAPDEPVAAGDSVATPDEPVAAGDSVATPDEPAAAGDSGATPDEPVAAGDTGATPDEPVDHGDNSGIEPPMVDLLEEGTFDQPVNRADDAPAADIADISASAAPALAAPEKLYFPKENVEAEAAPSGESGSEIERALPGEPEMSLQKAEADLPDAAVAEIPADK